MKTALVALLGLPLLWVFVLPGGKNSERRVASLSMLAAIGMAALYCTLLYHWVSLGMVPWEWEPGVIYRSGDFSFPLVLFVDIRSIVYLGITAFLGGVTIRYSRVYLHREAQYARFFRCIFLFLFGMNLLSTAGTLDLFFVGWEVIGLSSFLLIGFYSERTQPIRNALKVYSVYRLCDLGLLLGVWLGTIVWHHSEHFSNLALATTLLSPSALFGFSLLILLAAAGKSAQFPFCFWMPRAMEGPTPSSAVFYGALSVHAGVLLLLRTQAIWTHSPAGRVAVGCVGLVSALLATLVGRTQSNIKGQIAYASVTQVGLMLIELSLGLDNWVLVHFIGNACLRSYQLLISPSVVAHLLRVQGSAHTRLGISDWSVERRLPARLRQSLYVFALQEGYLEPLCRALIVNPLKSMGRWIQHQDSAVVRGFAVLTVIGLIEGHHHYPEVSHIWFEVPAALLMLFAALSGIAEKRSFERAWHAVGFSAALAGIAVMIHDHEAPQDVVFYLTGMIPGWLAGGILIRRLERASNRRGPSEFHGMAQEQPWTCFALFISFLVLAGFPISPAFIGQDLILHHCASSNLWLAGAIALGFVVNGLTLARIYTYLCLGPKDTGPRRAGTRAGLAV